MVKNLKRILFLIVFSILFVSSYANAATFTTEIDGLTIPVKQAYYDSEYVYHPSVVVIFYGSTYETTDVEIIGLLVSRPEYGKLFSLVPEE